MNNKLDYHFENFLEYHGDIEQVTKHINFCFGCGAKLLLSHMADYKNYIIQETSRCLDCGNGTRRIIHTIN